VVSPELVNMLAEVVKKLGPVVISRGNMMFTAKQTRNPKIYMIVKQLGPLRPEYYRELHTIMVENDAIGVVITAEGNISIVEDAWSSGFNKFVKIGEEVRVNG